MKAERDLTNIKKASKYIGRYLARPAILEYRISNYDGKSVTFWYENKKPKKKISVPMNILEFIGKLTPHIHPKGFIVVKRYGLYMRAKNKLSIEIIKLYNLMTIKLFRSIEHVKRIGRNDYRPTCVFREKMRHIEF